MQHSHRDFKVSNDSILAWFYSNCASYPSNTNPWGLSSANPPSQWEINSAGEHTTLWLSFLPIHKCLHLKSSKAQQKQDTNYLIVCNAKKKERIWIWKYMNQKLNMCAIQNCTVYWSKSKKKKKKKKWISNLIPSTSPSSDIAAKYHPTDWLSVIVFEHQLADGFSYSDLDPYTSVKV